MNQHVPHPVRLRWFASPHQAQFAKLALEIEGIRSTLTGGDLSLMLSYYGQAVSRIELYVDASEKNRAEEILQQRETENSLTNDWRCSLCDEVNGVAFATCWSCGDPASGIAAEGPPMPESDTDSDRQTRIRRAILLGILFPVPIGLWGLLLLFRKALPDTRTSDNAVRRLLQATFALIVLLMLLGMTDFVRLLLSMVPGRF